MSYDLSDYVDVAERIREFKAKYPDGTLQGDGEFVRSEAGAIIGYHYKAFAYRTADDPRPGVGIAFEPIPGKTSFTKDSEPMNAETSAWGRAIVALGFETKKIASANEVRDRSGSAARTDGNRGSAADTGQRSPQAAGPDDPGSFVVNFSKNYKGRGLTLAQIYYDENDAGFVKWIAEKSTFEDAKQAAIAYLVNPTAPGATPGHGQGEDIPFAPTITGYGL